MFGGRLALEDEGLVGAGRLAWIVLLLLLNGGGRSVAATLAPGAIRDHLVDVGQSLRWLWLWLLWLLPLDTLLDRFLALIATSLARTTTIVHLKCRVCRLLLLLLQHLLLLGLGLGYGL